MLRDVQVRVVFCDWLAWLLRMKTSGYKVDKISLLDNSQTKDLATPTDEADLTRDVDDVRPGSMTSVSLQATILHVYMIRIYLTYLG